MKFLTAFQKLYSNHFLLAATSSLIIIGFIGSVNVFLIAQRPEKRLFHVFVVDSRNGKDAFFSLISGSISRSAYI